MTSEKPDPNERTKHGYHRRHTEHLHNGKEFSSSSDGQRRVSEMTSASSGAKSHKSPESELRTAFDPMKDLHMWTMWRAAVNGRIVDEVRARNQPVHRDEGLSRYGRALMKTPLDRFIRVDNGSHNIAHLMMDPHQVATEHLHTKQFVFYGVPRVVLKKPKTRSL